MSQSFTTDDLQTLATYPFKDPDWKRKFLIGSLVMVAGYVVPVLPLFLLYGYCAQMMRQVINTGADPYLPEWDDYGKFFVDGAKLFGAGFIYMLPVIFLVIIGYGLFFAGAIVPAALAEAGDDVSPLLAIVPIVGIFGGMAFFGLGMAFILAIGLLLKPIIGHVVATDDFSAAFRVQEWWAIFRANLVGFIVAYVLLIAVWMVGGFALQILYITIIGCCLLPFILPPFTFYLALMWGTLTAQAYQTGVEQLAAEDTVVTS